MDQIEKRIDALFEGSPGYGKGGTFYAKLDYLLAAYESLDNARRELRCQMETDDNCLRQERLSWRELSVEQLATHRKLGAELGKAAAFKAQQIHSAHRTISNVMHSNTQIIDGLRSEQIEIADEQSVLRMKRKSPKLKAKAPPAKPPITRDTDSAGVAAAVQRTGDVDAFARRVDFLFRDNAGYSRSWTNDAKISFLVDELWAAEEEVETIRSHLRKYQADIEEQKAANSKLFKQNQLLQEQLDTQQFRNRDMCDEVERLGVSNALQVIQSQNRAIIDILSPRPAAKAPPSAPKATMEQPERAQLPQNARVA